MPAVEQKRSHITGFGSPSPSQRKQLLGEDLDDEGEGANEWASRITADVVNVDRDAATYNIAALEGATMQI